MHIDTLPDPEAVTRRVAELIIQRLEQALALRSRAVLALSGGSTPKPLYRLLARAPLDWSSVHLVQVDERFAPLGDEARNYTSLKADLIGPTAVVGHPMPVAEDAPVQELTAGYAAALDGLCEGIIDVVHLGLGQDGHTASLVPGDPALQAAGGVAVTASYQGHRRMTLTAPLINTARTIVWQIVGSLKHDALRDLLAGSGDIPAGLIRREPDVWVVADDDAMTGSAI
ncbi:MAG: 6-phosphogluconolactonase [Euzebya sp.]